MEYSWHVDPEHRNKAVGIYVEAQKRYHQCALEMNTFIKLQKIKSIKENRHIKLNLYDINLNKVYKIDLKNVNKAQHIDEWKKKCFYN